MVLRLGGWKGGMRWWHEVVRNVWREMEGMEEVEEGGAEVGGCLGGSVVLMPSTK